MSELPQKAKDEGQLLTESWFDCLYRHMRVRVYCGNDIFSHKGL